MIVNLLVFVLLALMAMWFSSQGLFTAVVHLFLTVIAGTLAFAVWEPITVNYLLSSFISEYAWAIGLLAPFALFLLLLRLLIDKYVPGNLNFHNLANSIGGGAVGVVNGVLTVGLLVIALQFVGNFGLFGYQPYKLSPNGRFERDSQLWIPVDDMTASLFTTISGGSMNSGNSIQRMYGDLVESAAAFQTVSRTYARYAIAPDAVNLTRMFALDESADVPTEILPGSGRQVLAVTTTIQVSGSKTGARDSDGTFTATKAQVALLAEDPDGRTHLHYPAGFVVNETYVPLSFPGEVARSDPSVASENFDWLFAFPIDQTPLCFRIKNLRFELPGTMASPQQTAEYLATVTWREPEPEPEPAADAASDEAAPASDQAGPASNEAGPASAGPDSEQPPTTQPPPTPEQSEQPEQTLGPSRSGGAGSPTEGFSVVVDDKLPVVLSRNWLSTGASNVRTQDNTLLSADGIITVRETERVAASLAVEKIAYPPGTRIVQVRMQQFRARSMLGQAYQFAAQTQAPVLNSSSGDDYFAIGYTIHRSGTLEVHLNPDNVIRAMSQVNITNLQPDDTLILYFQVGSGVQLNEFRVGNASRQAISPPLAVP